MRQRVPGSTANGKGLRAAAERAFEHKFGGSAPGPTRRA